MRFIFNFVFLLFLCLNVKGQNATQQAIYMKAGVVMSGAGYASENLVFGINTIDVRAGDGIKLFIGSGIALSRLDFELTLEQSMQSSFFADFGSRSNDALKATFWQSSLYTSALYKIPTWQGHFFRFGGGPLFALPGSLKIKNNGVAIGKADYDMTLGAHAVVDFLIKAKNVYLAPGMRLNFSELKANNITFTEPENVNKLSSVNNGSFNLYLLIRF